MKKLSLVFVFLLLMANRQWAAAQEQEEKKEAPQKDVDLKSEPEQKEAPLPKISLPEFVITGNEKIDLNIKPKQEKEEERIFVPDGPTPGSRLMEIEGVLFPKQIKQFAQAPSALNGKLSAGYGFYQTPQFDGWFGQYDKTNSFILNGYYSSSEGHLDNVNAGGWKGGAAARARYVMPESSFVLPYMQLSGDFRYGRESYYAYGSANPTEIKDISLFDLSLGVGSRYALPYKSLSGFDYTGTAGLRSFSFSSASASETEFSLGGVATTRFFNIALRGQIEYRTTDYTMNIPTNLGQWFAIKGEAQTLIFPSMQMTIALQQFFYRGSSGAGSGRLYPQLELRYFLTEDATMSAGFSPTVERNTLESISRQNKYVDDSVSLRHTDLPVVAFAGMEVTPFTELTISAKFSYKHTNNYPTFLDTTGAKVWEVQYLSNVRSTKVDVSMVYRLNEQQNITAYFSSQDVKQKDASTVLPNIPAYSFGAVYHHFFDVGLHLEGLAEYVAPRYSNVANTRKNAGYLFTSVKGEMELFEQFRGFAEIQNLLNQKYYIWDGYQERTIYLLLGVSYQW